MKENIEYNSNNIKICNKIISDFDICGLVNLQMSLPNLPIIVYKAQASSLKIYLSVSFILEQPFVFYNRKFLCVLRAYNTIDYIYENGG